MAEAKIQIKLGAIELSGEGEEKWVAAQLDKILTQAAGLLALAPPAGPNTGGQIGGDTRSGQAGSDADVPLGTS